MKIEWPNGSGRVADYTPGELAYIKGFIAQRERGEIDTAVMNREIGHLHDMKVEFGVSIDVSA